MEKSKRRALRLRFCPHTNDLLYPKEIPEEKKLIYKCKNCGYEADIPEESYCVYVNEVRHSFRILDLFREWNVGGV